LGLRSLLMCIDPRFVCHGHFLAPASKATAQDISILMGSERLPISDVLRLRRIAL
jgi:hypothetical protein